MNKKTFNILYSILVQNNNITKTEQLSFSNRPKGGKKQLKAELFWNSEFRATSQMCLGISSYFW